MAQARRLVPALAVAGWAAAALLPGPPARAAEVRVDGSYRLRFALDTNLLLDDQGDRLGQTRWAEHRLRLTPKLVEEGRFELQSSFDVLSGLVAGQLAPGFQGLGWTGRSKKDGLRASGFEFRHLFAEARFPAGVLRLGQMPNQWGMGLVAHGGDDGEAPDYGDARFGDIVDRVLFAGRPLSFLGPHEPLSESTSAALAGDLIYRDRYASLLHADGGGLQWGDVAFQAVGMLRFSPDDRTSVGAYLSRRVQSYAKDQGNLHVWIFDLHARALIESALLGGSTFSFELEAAERRGGTSHAVVLSSPGASRIDQQGLAARVRLSVRELEAEVEGGYASGDADPFDDTQAAFAFNRDYKVSLVLFDEVLLFQTQNAARRLADPAFVGRPPPGVDLVPTEGAVTNALYLRPLLRYRPRGLGGRVRFTGSALWARAPQPYVDPYRSLLDSRPENPFGAPARQNYGLELDAAVSIQQALGDRAGFELGAQGGVLLPGDAFDLADGSRMARAWAGKLRATLSF